MAVQFCECMKSHGFGHFKGKKNKVCELYQDVKKERYNFADKGLCIVKAMVFPVVMYGCESWTIKKAERHKELTLLNCGVVKDS